MHRAAFRDMHMTVTSMVAGWRPFIPSIRSRLLLLSMSVMLMAGADMECECRVETSASDASGLSVVRGRRGDELICLFTSSIPPILNTVDAGMHRGSTGPAEIQLRIQKSNRKLRNIIQILCTNDNISAWKDTVI